MNSWNEPFPFPGNVLLQGQCRNAFNPEMDLLLRSLASLRNFLAFAQQSACGLGFRPVGQCSRELHENSLWDGVVDKSLRRKPELPLHYINV